MKYYLIAGEASGDLHGSNLMKALAARDSQAQFRMWGGDRMASVGGELVRHYRDTAYMGFVEVVFNLPDILRNLKRCKADVLEFAPDALILIDYPGFNMRIARWAHHRNIKVFYYIAPQVWAWKAKRAKELKEIVDELYVILPFEKAFFENHGFKVKYFGHPLLDALNDISQGEKMLKLQSKLDGRPVLALLPGSRLQEIKAALPIMLETARQFEDYQVVIGGLKAIERKVYTDMIEKWGTAELVLDQTHQLLSHANLAVVSSGTATLESALLGVPQVVCYKGSYLSFQVAKRLVNVPYISLVNLILDRPLVTELIQNDFNVSDLKKALSRLQEDKNLKTIEAGYEEIRTMLKDKGASGRVAADILNHLQN